MTLKRNLAALILLGMVLGILFYPALFQKKVLLPADQLNTMILPYSYQKPVSVHNHFLNDAITQYYIYKSLTRDALSQGRFFYWNPLILGGYPQYALTMAGNFDLTNGLLPLAKTMPWAYLLQTMFTFLIAGMSMYLLLRYYGHCFWTAIIIGVAYMLNSMFITTCFHRWILASFCWMPLVLLFLDKGLSRPSRVSYLLGGLFLALAFMGSSIQTASFILMVIAGYAGIFWWIQRRRIKGSVWPALKTLLLIAAVGFGLSMVMWFPVAELFYFDVLQNGSWGRLGGGTGTLWQRLAAVPLLSSFAMPELIGSVRAYDLTKLANASLAHFNGYVGFLPLVFGIFAMSTPRQKKPPHWYIATALILSGLLIPLATPLLRYVYHRFFIVYILGICLLSASGMTVYLKAEDRRNFLRPLGWITGAWIFIICGLVAVQMLNYFFHPQLVDYVRRFVESRLDTANLLAGNREWYLNRVYALFSHFNIASVSMFFPIAGISLGLLLVYAHIFKKISTRIFLALFLFITASQLIFFARSWLPLPDAEKYPPYPNVEATDFLKKDNSIYRVYIDNSSQEAHPIFSPNVLAMYGIETINGYESVESPSVNWLVQGFNPAVLGAANVKYVIGHEKNGLPTEHLEPVFSGSGITIYKNKLYLHRAFMVYDLAVMSVRQCLAAIRSGAVDMSQTACFEEAPAGKLSEPSSKGTPLSSLVEIKKYAPERIEIEVSAGRSGYLILSNTFYPGWKYFLDGRETPLLKANAVMWAVFVPEGKHTLGFFFRPRVFYRGLGVSLSVFFLSLTMLLTYFLRRKR